MNDILKSLVTEQRNEATRHIDQLPTIEILKKINQEDHLVAEKIHELLPIISDAVEMIASSLKGGGRLFYFGAGTSGRLGILDASECPPTYGTAPSLVQGVIAGGYQAITDAVEGAEDNDQLGEDDVLQHNINRQDIVVGIASSGRTPYVLGAMRKAKQLGAKVIGITNNEHSPMQDYADLMVEAIVGPEVIMGSTRMKAGSAQKMILNMLTTVTMIKLGKVYDNLMVDLQPSNTKLVDRAKRIIKLATDEADERVEVAYKEADGHVKTAIVSILSGVDCKTAEQLLQQAQGFVKEAIGLTAGKENR